MAIMMKTLRTAVLSAVVAVAVAQQPKPDPSGTYQRVLLTDAANEGGVCIDGTPGAYYIRQPMNTSTSNDWIIFHEGGGWCGSDSNCYDRGMTDLGSSKNYPTTAHGIEDIALYDLPPFDTYTIVYAKYCDGGSWTGENTSSFNNTVIHYKGRVMLDGMFKLLLANGLQHADRLMYSGCSAGALTAYIHLDYVKSLMPTTSLVIGAADAMFSLQWKAYNNPGDNYYTHQFTWGYTAWNSSRSINQECLEKYGHEGAWVCFHGAIAVSFLQTPMLVVNSKYDTWQERGVLQLNNTLCPGSVDVSTGNITLCLDASSPEQKYWVTYGDAMVAAAHALPQRHGVFLTNCPIHCQGDNLNDPSSKTGLDLGQALVQWAREAFAAVAAGTVTSFVAPRSIPVDSDKCLRKN